MNKNAASRKTATAAAPATSLEDIIKDFDPKAIREALAKAEAGQHREGYIEYIKANIANLDDRTLKTVYSNVRRVCDVGYKPRYQPKAK